MNQALLNKKLKDSFREVSFSPSEDTLTSSVIGILQYLSGDLFWRALRDSCGEKANIEEDSGELLKIFFWRRFLPDEEVNVNHVEPDVYCEFENFNIIIEAKKGDAIGQDETQWRKEIISYTKEIECDKKLYLVALGGNNSLKVKTLDYNESTYTIYGASWQRLLDVCINLLHSDDLTLSDRRILSDVVDLFSKHHYYSISWLKDLKSYDFSTNSLETLISWSTNKNNEAEIFLSKLPCTNYIQPNSINTLSLWKII